MALFLIEANNECTSIKTDTKNMDYYIDACRALIKAGADANNEEIGVVVAVLVSSYIEE